MNVLTLRVPLSGSRTRSHKRERNSGNTWSLLLSHCRVLKQQASPVACQSTGGRGNSSPSWTIQSSAGQVPAANYVVIGPHYFRAMEIPLRRGRSFNDHDTQSGERVVIVNEELVRSYWPGQNPLGKQLRIGGQGPWRTVVGVAGDVLSQGPDGGFNPEMYIRINSFRGWSRARNTCRAHVGNREARESSAPGHAGNPSC